MTATAADTRDILDELKKRRVRFLLLQFTDLLGVNKAVEVPASQFEKALAGRSEEHTSELQSQSNLVCRLLLEKKKIQRNLGAPTIISHDWTPLTVILRLPSSILTQDPQHMCSRLTTHHRHRRYTVVSHIPSSN